MRGAADSLSSGPPTTAPPSCRPAPPSRSTRATGPPCGRRSRRACWRRCATSRAWPSRRPTSPTRPGFVKRDGKPGDGPYFGVGYERSGSFENAIRRLRATRSPAPPAARPAPPAGPPPRSSILEPACQVRVVRGEVEVPVAAEPEQDRLLLAVGRLLDHRADRVRRLRRRDDAPRSARTGPPPRTSRPACTRAPPRAPRAHERRPSARRRGSAARWHGRRRHEAVAERVHRHQGRHPHGVAVVVGVGAARERRARGGLGGDDARPRARAQEREHESAEVRAAADAADDHARHLGAGQLEPLRSPPARSPSCAAARG